MKTIGVRELRQRASEFLREVEQGRSVEVTSHGRPVARLVPVRDRNRRRLLTVRGRLVPGEGDLLDLGAPLPAARDVPRPGRLIARARASER